MPAWSIQTGVAATHHAVLKRMSTSAFTSVVPTALLTRVLLVFPSSALFVFLLFYHPLDCPTWAIQRGFLGTLRV